MKPPMSPQPEATEDAGDEIANLIKTLHETGQRLEKLTGGEVDAVSGHDGRPFILLSAQERLRLSDAAKQSAILNAIPAHIALLDNRGDIISVNEAWRQFATDNKLPEPEYGVGLNYLEICDAAHGLDADEAHQVCTGIRSVLSGSAKSYSVEYPCHSPTENRWFLMTVTPLADELPHGAVAMHLNITARKLSEEALRASESEFRANHQKLQENEGNIKRLNRVYAMLSSINTLIVRARDREELYRETCRIAVEEGGFRMALIALVDRDTMSIVPVASSGTEEALTIAIKKMLSSPEEAPKTMVARAISEKRFILSNDSKNDSGVEFIREYVESRVCSMAVFPLIVLNEVIGCVALYSGETDFFHDAEVRLLRELVNDVTFALDFIDKQERLNYLAFYDPLTGLANRNLFLERVKRHIDNAASGGHGIAVFLIDVDRFRNINDSLGRSAGDELLRQVAQWLKNNIGNADILARIDADHFAVVMPKVSKNGNLARLVDKKITASLEHRFNLNGAHFRIATKVGAALFPDDGTDAEILLKNAEAALKKAKTSGERFLFHTPKMTEAVAGKLALENQLRRALDNEEFVLHYQPKVNIASGKMTSAEALIRWNDPASGLVPPGNFIPILEETGLIYEVGRWALRKAVADYLHWRSAGLPAVRIAVNVSPLQLSNHSFVAEIREIIDVHEHAAAGLELEITESLIMADIKHNITSLHAIRDMGVTIAIDDFGTGFSSLSYLARLPVDTLKIDRSFVTDINAGPERLALVSTIINLAHSLKLKVVAEGVETEEQARLLRLLSCDEMQGFLFSKPVAADIFEQQFLSRLAQGIAQ
jgi:diguanylate cyclase (GGDEF)-like protein